MGYYVNATPKLTWDVNRTMMMVEISFNGVKVLSLSGAEIIESFNRRDVLDHVKICDDTPWLKRWQNEKHEALIEILKK